MRLELEGAPIQSLSVPVGGFVSNDISASPRLVVLNASPLGVARRVVVIHGPKPFSIRAITSTMNGFEARFEPAIEAHAHAIELLIPVDGRAPAFLDGRACNCPMDAGFRSTSRELWAKERYLRWRRASF